MSRKLTNIELSAIAQRAVMDDGRISDGAAEWSRFGDFKMRWARSPVCIEFQVSDYLNYAGEEVLYSLFRSVLNKIFFDDPKGQKGMYSDDLLDYVHSQAFRDLKRGSFLSRKRYQDGSGDVHDLYDILDDIVENGESLSSDIIPVWSDNPDKMVSHSVIFRVVTLPKELDREEIPAEVIRKLLIFGADSISRGIIVMRNMDLESEIPLPVLHLTAEENANVRRFF